MVDTQSILTSFHVLAAVFWVGAGFALNVAMTLAMRAEDPGQRVATLRLVAFFGPWVFTPLALIVLVSGIWLTSKYYDFGDLWISVGFAGLIVAALVALLYLAPQARAGLAAVAQGSPPRPNRWVPIVARLNLLLLSAVVVIMVIKPG